MWPRFSTVHEKVYMRFTNPCLWFRKNNTLASTFYILNIWINREWQYVARQFKLSGISIMFVLLPCTLYLCKAAYQMYSGIRHCRCNYRCYLVWVLFANFHDNAKVKSTNMYLAVDWYEMVWHLVNILSL